MSSTKIQKHASIQKSILEVVHESAKGLFDAGLMDAKTMYNFDITCLNKSTNTVDDDGDKKKTLRVKITNKSNR